MWKKNDWHYSHKAAISLGRSAPNWPKRWLLARKSKGEWLRMELKVNGYMARENLVTWCSWCSLLVAILERAGGGYAVLSAVAVIVPTSGVAVVGSRSKWPFKFPRNDLTGPRFCRTETETSRFRHTNRAATATSTTPLKKTAAIGSGAPARPPTEQGQSNTSLLLYVCLQSSEMISGNAVWFQSAGLHYKESLCSVCQPDLNQPVRTQPATTWAQLTLHSERWQCAHSRCTSAPRGRGLRHTFERTTLSPIYLPLKSDVVPLRCCQGVKRGQPTPPVSLPLSSPSLIS